MTKRALQNTLKKVIEKKNVYEEKKKIKASN